MKPKRTLRYGLPLVALALGTATSFGQVPSAAPIIEPSSIELVRKQEPTAPVQPAPVQPAPVQPAPVQPRPDPVQPAPQQSAPQGTQARPTESANTGGSTSAVNLAGGATPGAAANTANAASAPDLGSLLSRSQGAQGVEVQKRNSVIADPRVRGLRSGQFYTTGDGAPYFPARLDLDTPISKFDPGSIYNVVIQRGPYTSLLGPAFAFLDVATLDTQRSKSGGVEYGGRTNLSYQSNGDQLSALQAVEVRGSNYGFRGTYNILQGNDYRAGDGTRIPSSYLSNNFNYALGFDLTDTSSIEFKGIRNWQENVELPGLFFDIARTDTESYSLRYKLRDALIFQQVTLDLWYNGTAGTGTTRGAAKQAFVNTLLAQAFREGGLSGLQFQDESTSQFAERSIGYRFTTQYGNNKDEWTLFLGTDLNVFGQNLTEDIRFRQTVGTDPRTSNAVVSGAPAFTQQQSIPGSNSVDTGLFFESMLPIEKRWILRSGGRLDWVRTSTNPRVVSGSANIFGLPQQAGTPFLNPFTVNPGLYSADPLRNTMPPDRADLTT
ncbi:MAG: hypothetical protein ACRCZF_00430, partial [Gemmataceae bacterium]